DGRHWHAPVSRCPHSLTPIDLPAHDRDRPLIDLRGIPFLDRRKIRLARLVAGAGAPAMRAQAIRGRGQGAGGAFAVAAAIAQIVLGQHLPAPAPPIPGPGPRAARRACITKFTRGERLRGEISRPPEAIGGRCDGGEFFLVPVWPPEAAPPPPDRDRGPRRYA